jgi:hypothetical protein
VLSSGSPTCGTVGTGGQDRNTQRLRRHHRRCRSHNAVSQQRGSGSHRHLALDQMAFSEFLKDLRGHQVSLVTLLVHQ